MLRIHAQAQTRQLVASRPLLSTAYRSQSAVAALNFYNAETLLAHVRAANALCASIILQTTESTIYYLGLVLSFAMAVAAAEKME
jgi:fructose/tagatose bisphosphate aldolase